MHGNFIFKLENFIFNNENFHATNVHATKNLSYGLDLFDYREKAPLNGIRGCGMTRNSLISTVWSV